MNKTSTVKEGEGAELRKYNECNRTGESWSLPPLTQGTAEKFLRDPDIRNLLHF